MLRIFVLSLCLIALGMLFWHGGERTDHQQSDKRAEVIVPAEKPVKEAKPTSKYKIAIVIDDLGVNKKTLDTIALPAPITLAFLPDQSKTPQWAKEAHEKGAEIWIHMPMEAMKFNKDEKSTLYANMDAEQVKQRVAYAMSRLPMATGMNNHTGSKFTSQPQSMDYLGAALSGKGLLFLDSRTTAKSVAKEMTDKYALPFMTRDVFLDHFESLEEVEKALAKTEKIAERRGYAIAIGHPKEHTLQALKAWLPTLQDKDIEIVPLSSLYDR